MRLLKMLSKVLILILLTFSIFSCGNDNPITPIGADTTIDSARYKWTEYINSYYADNTGAWIRDTNDIYFNNPDGYLHFYNGVITQFPVDDFKADFVGGTDKNSGYLIGHSYLINDSAIRIKKWNGSSFSELPVINNKFAVVNKYYIFKPDEIWMVSYTSELRKFNGNALVNIPINFPVGDMCSAYNVYFDSTAQKVRAAVVSIHNSLDFFSIYDYDGSSFNKSFEMSLPKFNIPIFINGYIVRVEEGKIKILLNNDFVSLASFNGLRWHVFMGGLSRNNIFMIGDPGFSNDNFVYNWNGTRWSRECSITGAYTYIDEKVIVVSSNNKILLGVKK